MGATVLGLARVMLRKISKGCAQQLTTESSADQRRDSGADSRLTNTGRVSLEAAKVQQANARRCCGAFQLPREMSLQRALQLIPLQNFSSLAHSAALSDLVKALSALTLSDGKCCG